MKSHRPLTTAAGTVLARDAEVTSKPSAEARAAAIAAIARTMNERKQRERTRWRVFGALAVAAAVAGAVGVGRMMHQDAHVATNAPPARTVAPAAASFVRGSPAVVRQGARRELVEGAALEPGDRILVEPGSRTTIALAGGSYLVADQRAELVLVSAAPRTTFDLASGSVHADVAKLGASERFVIRTSDAEVEVHGTSFDVTRAASDPSCGSGTTTRVKVREGVVAVRSGGTETFVRANEEWPAGCTAAPPPARPEPVPSARPSAPRPATTAAAPEGPSSDLSAQNDQFAAALEKKKAGDALGAIAAFEELLARYPSSHLAQSARAERMKLLSGVNRDRARLAARDYLERYPSGFARGDAELILAAE